MGTHDRSNEENPYAAPCAEIGPPASRVGQSADGSGAELVRRGWLARGFRVSTREGIFLVDYVGIGIGEKVLVDGRIVASSTGIIRFVPRFDFEIGSRPSSIEVNINILLCRMRGFRLRLDGAVLYEEGRLW